jgi:hypothetical protein
MLDLRKLSEDLHGLGTASSQRDVSSLAGRKGSWLSSTVAHGRRPSTAALVALVFNLKEIIAETLKAADEAEDQDDRNAYLGGAADLQAWVQHLEAELARRIENHEA